MQVTVREVGEVLVMTLNGRLILEEVEASLRGLLDPLIEQGHVKLVLDMHDVTYIDSAGLGYLISRYVRVQRRGGDIKLVQPTPRVAHVLEITRLERVFELYQSEEDAVRRFERARGRDTDPVLTSRRR